MCPLVRPSLWLAAIVTLGACTSRTSSTEADSGDGADEGGNPIACTSIGGTCQPTLAPGCPLSQQNPELCGNVVLVCCLPAAAAAVGEEDAESAEAGVIDAAGSVDAAGGVDAARAADGASMDGTVD